jgi:hypothetical protein
VFGLRPRPGGFKLDVRNSAMSWGPAPFPKFLLRDSATLRRDSLAVLAVSSSRHDRDSGLNACVFAE